MKRKLITKSALLTPRQTVAAPSPIPNVTFTGKWDLTQDLGFSDEEIALFMNYDVMQGMRTLRNEQNGFEIDIRRRREDLLGVGDVTFQAYPNRIDFAIVESREQSMIGLPLLAFNRKSYNFINKTWYWHPTMHVKRSVTDFVPLLGISYIEDHHIGVLDL